MWQCLSILTTLQELHTYNLNMADIPREVLLLTQVTSLQHRDCLEECTIDLSPLQNLVDLDISGSNIESHALCDCCQIDEEPPAKLTPSVFCATGTGAGHLTVICCQHPEQLPAPVWSAAAACLCLYIQACKLCGRSSVRMC